MPDTFLITSALLYANGKVHFGHLAGAYLPADMYARYLRMKQKEVLFISGSDEYGIAITLSAELEKRSPAEQVDHYHAINEALMQKMQISFDYYGRTTGPHHKPCVDQFFLDLYKNGYIEEKTVPELYSEVEGRFLADRYVEGICPKCGFDEARGDECPRCAANYEAKDLKNPRSKLTKTPLVLKETRHWFLQLEKFKQRLVEFVKHKEWKSNVTHFVLPYIEDLHERAISRDLKWGVPIPLADAEGKVLYVWFDAPIGYISITKEWAEKMQNPSLWEKFWLDPGVRYTQFIGKDNIVFHALFFPAMVMGQNIPYKQVDTIVASEFLNLEKKQFSKSSGWYIDLEAFLKDFSSDSIRFALLANSPETQDAEFTFDDFFQKCNGDLVGKFGNLVHRTLHFLREFLEGRIPEPSAYTEDDEALLAAMEVAVHAIDIAYGENKNRKAIAAILDLCSLGNAYFDKKAPWKLNKDKEKRLELETIFYVLLPLIKNLAVVAFPVVPDAMQRLWQFLGFTTSLDSGNFDELIKDGLIPNTSLPAPHPLFAKIDPALL